MANSKFVKLSILLLISCVILLAKNVNTAKISRNILETQLATSKFDHTVTSSFYRLNLTVVPLTYNLRLRPVLDDGFPTLEKFTSPSSVSILVQSISSSNTITLHQRDLNIAQENVTVTNLNTGRKLPLTSQSFEVERDLYEIELGQTFQPGDLLEIYIPYTVTLSQTENVGIYLGHYVDPATNELRYLSATKLEPYHARKVFPVFDEPSIKATFKVSVGRLNGKYNSLSNMKIIRTDPDPEYEGWVWDHYDETVRMSSYLFCVIVSDFANTTVHDSKGRPVSTWAPKHDIDVKGGEYGAVAGERILNYFENLVKMDYALPKLDAVALPQFASGAMENFGVLTFRYGYLVWIPGENTEAERRKVTQVLAHEIAHQWYGNILTCGWWSEIWLNEGFARFLQFWAMQEVIPEFLIEESIVTDTTQLAMVFDQGPNTHPVKNSAESTTESAAVFDRIAYEKGASLLRMMEGFITRPLFEEGIIDTYLQRMQWASAFQDDLFQAIQDVIELNNAEHLLPTGSTIKDIMDSWTLQSGYPLVRVSAIDQHTIYISQEKFVFNDTNKLIVTDDEENERWWIPVKVVSKDESGPNKRFNLSDKLPDIWISNNENWITFSRNGLNTSRLIMVNPDATGYYRVLYDDKLTDLIKQQLFSNDWELISSSSRSQLLDDYFNLAWANYIEVDTALELTEYIGAETASNVWTTVLTHLKPILNKFSQSESATRALKGYLLPRLESSLTLIGNRQREGEQGIYVTLRAQLLDAACQLESYFCYEYASELMSTWMENPQINPFPVDIQSSLYSAAISASSTSSPWIFVMERFYETKKDNQKTLLLNALAASQDSEILHELLRESISNLQEYTSQILSRIAINPTGREIVYEFIKENLSQGSITPEIFASVISTLSGYWKEQSQINELRDFIESMGSRLEPVLESLNSSVRNIQVNIQWWNTFGRQIQAWFEQQQ